MKRIIIGILAVVMLLSLAACGAGGGNVAGSYNLKEVTNTDGSVLDAEAIKTMGMDSLYKLDIKEGGTGSMTINGESLDFTWKENTFTTGDGMTYSYKYKDNTLSIKQYQSMDFVL